MRTEVPIRRRAVRAMSERWPDAVSTTGLQFAEPKVDLGSPGTAAQTRDVEDEQEPAKKAIDWPEVIGKGLAGVIIAAVVIIWAQATLFDDSDPVKDYTLQECAKLETALAAEDFDAAGAVVFRMTAPATDEQIRDGEGVVTPEVAADAFAWVGYVQSESQEGALAALQLLRDECDKLAAAD